jgi:hypothetical protein
MSGVGTGKDDSESESGLEQPLLPNEQREGADQEGDDLGVHDDDVPASEGGVGVPMAGDDSLPSSAAAPPFTSRVNPKP